jgi:tetratricopeptide (TPR) repeat protein
MPDVIACPTCHRRLRLPEGIDAPQLRCPACHTTFSPETAPLPVDRAADEPPDQPRHPPGPPRRAARRPLPLPGADEPPPRPRRRWLGLPLALGGLFALLLVGSLALVWALWPSPPPKRAPYTEDDEQRRQQLRQAFANQPLVPDDQMAREIKALLTDLGAAFRAGDGQRAADLFDADRMFDELAAQEVLPPKLLRSRAEFVSGLRVGLSQTLAQQAPLLAWSTFEVRSVKRLQGNEAVVIARHRDDAGNTLKMRWWVTRLPGTWKVYDLEDLDMGVRLSAEMGTAVAGGPGRAAGMARHAAVLRDAMVALTRGDVDTAERRLREVDGVRLPGKLEAVRLLAHAVVHLQRERPRQALDTIAKARARHPDMPVLDMLEGTTLNQLGQWDKALKRLEAYRDLLGEDDAVCTQLGLALRGVRRFPEAAASYRKALDYNPKNADAFLGLLLSLTAEDKRDDVPARFARLDNHRENFVVCAEELKKTQDGAGVEQLARAMRKLDPKFVAVDYYLCLAKAWAGRADQGVRLFRAALAGEADAKKRREYTREFLQAIARAGKPLEAYPAAPDAREAFRLLADELNKGARKDQLKGLVSAHAAKHPDDPLLPFYRGEVHVWEGKYALAEKDFSAGMARPPDRATLESFRASRVLARYHAGKALSAYREIGPRADTFRQLADLLFLDRKDDQLQALLDEHARAEPNDPDLLRYSFRLKVRRGKLDEAITLFRTALAKQADKDQRRRTVSEFLSDMAEAGKPLEGYRAPPDAREAFEIVAERLLRAGDRKGLRRLIDVHRGRDPDDPRLALYAGSLHLEEKDWAKAAAVLCAGWRKAPADLRERFRWKCVYAYYKAGRAPQAYKELGPRRETFTQLAHLLANDKKGKELEALVAAHRPHAGDDPDLLFHAARAKVLLRQPAEAAALLRQAHKKQSQDYQRRWYVTQLAQDMAEAGRPLEAYSSSPDRPAAFEALARALLTGKKAKELESLLKLHGKRHSGDTLYLFYSGELALLRNDLPAADRHFRAALAKAGPPQQWMARNGLYRARVRAGKVVETYTEVGPGPETFEALASVCLAEKNADQLGALLAAHTKAKPDDPNLTGWELERRWLKKDYEGALKLLAEHSEGALAAPRWRWTHDDYRVRCLVRLKRTDEAVRAAEGQLRGGHGNPVLVVLAHAARGGVKEALAAMDRVGRRGVYLGSCYRDPDLGPLLKTESFRPFRAKYPEPKEEPDEDDEP